MKHSVKLALYAVCLAGLPKQSYKAFFLHGPKQIYNSLIQAEQRFGFKIPQKSQSHGFFPGFFDHIAIVIWTSFLSASVTVALEKDYFSKHVTLNQLFIHNCAMQVVFYTTLLRFGIGDYRLRLRYRKGNYIFSEWREIRSHNIWWITPLITWIITGL